MRAGKNPATERRHLNPEPLMAHLFTAACVFVATVVVVFGGHLF